MFESIFGGTPTSKGDSFSTPAGEKRTTRSGKKSSGKRKSSSTLISEGSGKKKKAEVYETHETHGDADDDTPNKTYRKKHLRTKEVPFKRKVKVPVMVKKIVPIAETIKIKTKRLVEIEEYEEIEETYTVVERRTAYRDKVIWIKKIEKEEYEESIPVQKKRLVKRPSLKIREKEVEQEVVIQGSKLVEVPGFRVDIVEDIKVVQVEEWETYELVAQTMGDRLKGSEREIERFGGHEGRTVGEKVFPEGAEELRDVPDDDHPTDHVPRLHDVILSDLTTDYDPEDFVTHKHHHHHHHQTSKIVVSELNCKDEYFSVTNISEEDICMDGWRVHDQQVYEGKATRNVFSFKDKVPGLVLCPGDSVKVYSGPGSGHAREYDNKTEIHWFNFRVWDDDGDACYLVDPQGEIAHIMGAEGKGEVHAAFSPSRDVSYALERSSSKKSAKKSAKK